EVTFSAFVRDVSQRKQAESALRESEERFRMVARAAADTLWDWNLLNDEIWWSEGITTVFGYGPGVDTSGADFFFGNLHPDDRERVREDVRRALREGRREWSTEARARHGDGHYMDVAVRAYISPDEHGVPVRMVGGVNDISHRKHYENRLAEQAALLDKAHEAIVVLDMEGRISYWNKSAQRLYGWSEQEALGRLKYELLNEDPEGF